MHFYHDMEVDEYIFRALGLYHSLLTQLCDLKTQEAAAWGQFRQDVCARLGGVVHGESQIEDEGLGTLNLDAIDGRDGEEYGCEGGIDLGDSLHSSAARKIGGEAGRLPDSTIRVLTGWFEQHLMSQRGPYPDNDEKDDMIMKTAISIRQLDNWFTNKRRRDQRCKRLRVKWSKS